jgi:hypothetical protein
VFDRFSLFRFNTLFKNYDELAVATQWHQFLSLKHEIEEIRRYPSIQGYVITELTDINWEANGLMSMWRQPKIYAEDLAKLQQPDIVIVRSNKKNFARDEPIELEVLLSHYSTRDLKDAKIVWLNGAGQTLHSQPLSETIAPASVTSIAKRTQTAPEVATTKREIIRVQLLDQTGALVAENSATVFVYPKLRPADAIGLRFTGSESALKHQQLEAAGYRILGASHPPGHIPTEIVIAHKLDEEVKQYVEVGGRAIILAYTKDAVPNGSIKIIPRAGSDLDGNWVTNFNWVRTESPSSPFHTVAFTKILGFESENVVPRFVIQGIGGANFDDVLSGIFYGWLNNNAALAAQMRVGDGALLLTTFRFDEYGKDPYATHLLDSMIRYVSSRDFRPRLAVDF